MERKTKIAAADGQQDLTITRVFELPLELLFKAYITPEIVAQWMGTKVVRLESQKFGSYQFETTDPMGNKHGFCGVIHEYEENAKITRTFEMENTSYPVQLEYLSFEALDEKSSKFEMHVIYKSVEHRNQILALPFAQGINMAHERLESTVKKIMHHE